MKRLILLFSLLCSVCFGNGPQFMLLSAGVSTRTTYFGNCTSAGATPASYTLDWFGTNTWYSNLGSNDYVCPGTGPQTILSMGVRASARSTGGNIRMAIYKYAETSADGATTYDNTKNLVCQWSAAVNVNAAEQWWDSASFTGTPVLTGGQHYKIAVSNADSLENVAYTAGTNESQNLVNDYTGGFPDPIGTGSGSSNNIVTRIQISGNGTTPAAATQQSWFANTDYNPGVSGTSTGSSAHPYTHVQTVMSTRLNLTGSFDNYTQYIYASGATADDTAISDFTFGQFAPTSSHPLYIIGNNTSGTWNTSAYHLVPTDRTSYYGAINFNVDNSNKVIMDHVQTMITSTTAGHTNEVVYGTYTFLNGIVRLPGGTDVMRYFSSINGIVVKNTLMYGMGVGGAQSNALKLHSTSYIINNTIIGGTGSNGVDVATGATAYVENNYIRAGGGTLVSSGTLNVVTNATSDSQGDIPNVTYSTTNFNNVTTNNENLSLKTGSVLIGAGTATANTPAKDMTEANLNSPPDIGAIKF